MKFKTYTSQSPQKRISISQAASIGLIIVAVVGLMQILFSPDQFKKPEEMLTPPDSVEMQQNP
ncbi:MAG: hypothetical protein AAFQ68_07050 [Bacteroidota bacterium]